ncbi:MAG: ABC transporter permease [Chlorobiales bacterium]|jgi:cell division transport system permease protein|nr:ABC transporter permease [Chlorobiales bacterium]
MNLSYILRESFAGFRRAKLASAVSVITISVSLVLLGVFLFMTLSFMQVLSEVRGRIEVELFLSETVSSKEAKQLAAKINAQPSVRSLDYISKEQAAQIFMEEFGENIQTVLGTNPLPQSIKIKLKPEYATADSLERFIAVVSKAEGVTDVKYNKEFLAGIDRNARIFSYITAGIGLIISLASIALVSNTIRLTIHSKRDMIKTMELVGATPTFIRMPFLIEGVWQGMLGALFATISILLFVEFVVWNYDYSIYQMFSEDTHVVYAGLLIIGITLGFFGSTLSVRKYIGK